MSSDAVDLVTVTEAARTRLCAMLAQRGRGVGVRLVLKRAGCCGLAYALEYADAREPAQRAFGDADAPLLVAEADLPYLRGMRLDWAREGLQEGFVFVNPNERGRCGCGQSFRV